MEEHCDHDFDDLNKNGIKTYLWGWLYWLHYHKTAKNLEHFDTDEFRDFAEFFITSPKDVLPCKHCRKHFRQHLLKPEFNPLFFLKSRALSDFVYLIHNAVNDLLDKEHEPTCILRKYIKHVEEEKEELKGVRGVQGTPTENNFWDWLTFIAFGYPADIQLTYFSFAKNKDESKVSVYEKNSCEEKEMKQRMKTYILFFDLIKNFIDRSMKSSSLLNRWINAYVRNTPTPFTFSNRTQLLRWVLKMKHLCTSSISGENTYHPQEKQEEKENKAFIKELENLHPTRSST